jgi:hypothetical protein
MVKNALKEQLRKTQVYNILQESSYRLTSDSTQLAYGSHLKITDNPIVSMSNMIGFRENNMMDSIKISPRKYKKSAKSHLRHF